MIVKTMRTDRFAFTNFIDTGLNRYDIFVRCLAIDAFYGKNDFGFELYRKMQKLRIALDPEKLKFEEKFRELIGGVKEKGMLPEHPISLQGGLLSDGSHRASCAIYFKLPELYYISNPGNKVSYNKSWFDSRFSDEEIALIEKKRLEIFDSFNFFTYIMLWNSISDYFDEIAQDIGNSYKILSHHEVDVSLNFIREVYKCDDISPAIVEKKISYLKDRGPKMRILRLDIPNPRWRTKGNGKILSRVGEEIKAKYRTAYKTKVKDYYIDIIIHSSDNFDQSTYIRRTIDEMHPRPKEII